MTCCSQHDFKSPNNRIVTMPNEVEGKDPGQREQGTKCWHNQGRPGRSQRRQGTVQRICNAGDSPGSRDVSPDSRATSTTGRGNERQSDTSERRERSVPTSGWSIQSTQQTSQQPWTH